MEQSPGCFDRFWMAAMALVVAFAITTGIVVMNTNHVKAQESDWSRYGNGTLYLVTPVRGFDAFTILEPPHLQDGFLCAVVEEIGDEVCAPLANIAGLTPS
jgi:hypothetical protein